ncbi:GspH/FimT family pseudopilin [Lysobacter fragariae]
MIVMRTADSKIHGFTLIELMVAVAVVAILATLAAPPFADFLDRYRLRGAVDDVISVISNARAGAVKLDREVRVTSGSGSGGWCVGAVSAPAPTGGNRAGAVTTTCDCGDNSPACEVEGEPLMVAPGKHGGVSFTSSIDMAFDGQLGLVQPFGSTDVTLGSPTAKYALKVTVLPLGQATVCVPAGKPPVTGYSSC